MRECASLSPFDKLHTLESFRSVSRSRRVECSLNHTVHVSLLSLASAGVNSDNDTADISEVVCAAQIEAVIWKSWKPRVVSKLHDTTVSLQ